MVYVTLAWELDIADLKRLSLNGITYSTVSEEVKKHLLDNVFPQKWEEFITELKNLNVEALGKE